MDKLLLLFISVFPVVVIGRLIYIRDKDKEPFSLLFKLFLGGIGSCFLVLFISLVISIFCPVFQISMQSLNLFNLFLYIFIFIGLLEEFSKWFFVYIISYNNKFFDRIYDMIVYCVFVSLGFACLENILYVFDRGFTVGVIRALLAVPGHACDGVFMGYYLGLSKYHLLHGNKKEMNKNKLLSILVPALLHTFYDFCLFSGRIIFLVLFLIFIIVLYVKSIKKVNIISSKNSKVKYNDNYCINCGRVVDSDFCPLCGKKNI